MRTLGLAQSIGGALVAQIALASLGMAAPRNPDSPMDWPSTLSSQEINLKAQSFVDRGNAAYRAREYATAVEAYSELIKLKPGDPRAYYNRGNAFYKLEKLESALSDFSEALRIAPNFELALMNRANIYSRLANYAEAIVDYDRAAILKPSNYLVFYNRGVAHERLGDLDSANRDLSEAIRLNERDAASYAERGIAALRQGKAEAAAIDFDVALKLDPANVRATKGRNLLNQGASDSAKSKDISTAAVLEEMSHDGAIDALLDLAEQACLVNGENSDGLKGVASSRQWTQQSGEALRQASAVGAEMINGWVTSPDFGSLTVFQSKFDVSPPAFICSMTATLNDPRDYVALRAQFERRFKSTTTEASQDDGQFTSRYWLPHSATCDAKTLLIGPAKGSTFTIRMLHGRRKDSGS